MSTHSAPSSGTLTGTSRVPQPQLADLPERIDTVIIGAGQAGLSTAYHLIRRGIDCVVLDAAPRIGEQWRHQYDALRLFTSNKVNGLPGMKFPGPAHGFATKDELAEYLVAYAARFELPVRPNVRVRHLGRTGVGFRAETTRGVVEARNVVIATGPFGDVPAIPDLAIGLDESILQLHSSQYRRPGQLRGGAVLVVGGGHSGCDIALDTAATHPTTLSGRDPGEVPVHWDSPLVHLVMPMVMFSHLHIHTRRTAYGRRDREHVLHHGAPRLRVKHSQLDAAGVKLSEARVVGVQKGMPLLADGTVVRVANVVWATGCRHDYSWLDLPVLDTEGWPREYRGVAEGIEGLFFCGLAYQYSLASLNLHGVGRDAKYVAQRIAAQHHRPSRTRHGIRAVV